MLICKKLKTVRGKSGEGVEKQRWLVWLIHCKTIRAGRAGQEQLTVDVIIHMSAREGIWGL